MTMPDQSTYPQIKEMAAKIHDPANQVYGLKDPLILYDGKGFSDHTRLL